MVNIPDRKAPTSLASADEPLVEPSAAPPEIPLADELAALRTFRRALHRAQRDLDLVRNYHSAR